MKEKVIKDYKHSTWQMQLFERAYIRDRGWADAINQALAGESLRDLEKAAKAYLTEEEQTEFTEAERVKKAARKRIDAQKTDAYGGPVFRTKRERIRYRWAQSVEWNTETKQHRLVASHYKDVRQAISAKRSEELDRRIDEGAVNFCPYWRGIFMAVLIYLLIVRSTRPVRRFFARMGTGVEHRGEQFGEFLLRQLARLYKFASPFVFAHWKAIATIVLVFVLYLIVPQMILNRIENATYQYAWNSTKSVLDAQYEREATVRRAQEARELAEANAAAAAHEAELRAWNESQARYARKNPYVPTREERMAAMWSKVHDAEDAATEAEGRVTFYRRMLLVDAWLTVIFLFFVLYLRTGFNILAVLWWPFARVIDFVVGVWTILRFLAYVVALIAMLIMESRLWVSVVKFLGDTETFLNDVWHQIHDEVLCPPVRRIPG